MSISMTWPFGPCGALPPPHAATPASAAASTSLVRDAIIAWKFTSAFHADAGRLAAGIEVDAENVVGFLRVDRIVEQHGGVFAFGIESDARQDQTGEHLPGI